MLSFCRQDCFVGQGNLVQQQSLDNLLLAWPYLVQQEDFHFMGPRKNLTNQVFGRLTAIRYSNHEQGTRPLWICKCSCGKEISVIPASLINGKTKSCGCLKRTARKTHGAVIGGRATKTYAIWSAMRQRCENPKCKGYSNYGGRGIKVCPRWIKYENFLADMGEKPEGKSLDRFPNNDGNYEPGNCRWATSKEQMNNTRLTTKLTIEGVTKPLSEWAEESQVSKPTLAFRLRRKWNPKVAVHKPTMKPSEIPHAPDGTFLSSGEDVGMFITQAKNGADPFAEIPMI